MRGRLFFVLLSAFSGTAVQAAVSPQDNVDVGALLARQAPGTPQFECHSDCGGALGGSRSGRHCDNSTWVELFEDCLECANQFNIWRHYGNGLTAAAEACGLSAVPSPSGGGEEPAATTTVTPVGSFVTSEAPVTLTEDADSSSTSDAAEPSITEPPQTGAETTAPASASTSEPVTAGASGLAYASVSMMSVGTLLAVFIGTISW
ncbi:uncharacterized protein QC763_206785 [Podospora pseudopauciseta]|uniref:Uncharacterized protein n=1 Tax=Podospora pseudopauciseta TaxID=2093780 RepID=A0ABR0HPK7_9PEZI|nr:hypothetical protein QC763_206785 [Podospora pseudopauciseta]